MPESNKLAFSERQAIQGSKALAPMARQILKPFKANPDNLKARNDLEALCN